jgi:hypothetical protein
MIGISSLHTNKYGVVHLTVEHIGELYIDEQFAGTERHVIFIYLLRAHAFPSARLYEHAMLLCDYRNKYPFIVNPALQNDNTVGFIIKCKVDEFNTQNLRQSIEVLKDLQNKLENSVGK